MNNDYIELLIKVPEEIYKHTQEYEIGGFNAENDSRLFMAIKNGVVLPKGHKDIVDISLDGLYDLDFYNPDSWYEFCKVMENASVLVKADKEGKENADNS